MKLFFIGIIGIVIFSFFINWKYLDAYFNIKASFEHLNSGNYSKAANLMRKASSEVPEVKDLDVMAKYYSGLDYLTKDKNDQALKMFAYCENKLPASYNVNSFKIQARMGQCFAHKDYKGFLAATQAHFKIDSTSEMACASLASAYAAVYASEGDEDAKKLAYQYIAKAKAIDNKTDESKSYYDFIEYRINSREIIDREQFSKKFPKGWTKN